MSIPPSGSHRSSDNLSSDSEESEVDSLLKSVEHFSDLLQAMTFELALLLARLKQDQPLHDVHKLEPRFLRLINGAVDIVKNVNGLTKAARESDPLVYDPPTGATTLLDKQMTEISRLLAEIDSQLRHKAKANPSDNKL